MTGRKGREKQRGGGTGREWYCIDTQGTCKNRVEGSLRSKGISSKGKCLSLYFPSQYSIEGIGIRDRVPLL